MVTQLKINRNKDGVIVVSVGEKHLGDIGINCLKEVFKCNEQLSLERGCDTRKK